MNSSLTNIKNLGMLFAVSASFFLAATPSHAITTAFSNTDFVPSVDFNDGGVVDNDATTGGNINVGNIPNGFGDGINGFFTKDYLLLGADDSDTNIGASDTRGDSVAITTPTFTISSNTDDVTLLFDWAFQGNNSTSTDDEFSIGIIDSGLTAFTQFFKIESPNFGSNSGESRTLSGFDPGEYHVLIQLNEAGGVSPLNSAVGFDNISATSVPFEFSPSVGLIMMGGIFAFSRYAKSRKVKQELENI